MARIAALLLVVLASGALYATDPDISVRRGTLVFSSGGVDNLGDVSLTTPGSFTYSIDNLGSADLNLPATDAVVVTGTYGCTVTITAQPAQTTLAPAGTTDFTVEVTPTDDEIFGFTLSIASDDPDENPFFLAVIGEGDDDDDGEEDDDEEDDEDDEDDEGGSSTAGAGAG